MALTPLPAAPSRSDPSDLFAAKADAFLAALVVMQTEINNGAANLVLGANNAFTGINTFPTAAKFDNSLKAASTEFVQSMRGNLGAGMTFNTSTSIPASACGGSIIMNPAAAITLTLPAIVSVADGASLTFVNYSAFVNTISAAATNIIAIGASPMASFTLKPNCSATLIVINGAWQLFDDAAMQFSPLFACSILAAGYQKLPSGLIFQWGSTAAATAADIVQTLPIAFPTAFLHIFLTQSYTAGSGSIGYAASAVTTLTSFTWRGSTVGNGFRFLAIGY